MRMLLSDHSGLLIACLTVVSLCEVLESNLTVGIRLFIATDVVIYSLGHGLHTYCSA